MRARWIVAATAAFVGIAAGASAQAAPANPTINLKRAAGTIKIDGDLSDEGWRNAARVEKWYEIQPGDNAEPPVRSIGYLTYDNRFLYAAFEFDDPEPSAIRAPLGDHDNINGNSMDFGGIFLDTLDTHRTAVEFFATPSNVQYDAVTDDASGENPSPDFYWDSAAKITDKGWTLEMRIPFSSLRYHNGDPQKWGIILFRNYPRLFRHQITSVTFPRGSNCTVCRESALTGLEGLPGGGHVVAAPYASASQRAQPRDDVLGAPLVNGRMKGRLGVDVKYTPNPTTALDATIRPDFSQIESDTAQISANERFALFFPEKRPFFLEGVDLFNTPIQAVYTRTITDPTWGARLTGKAAGIRYTALVAQDAGGGSVILPGSNGSSTAPQDFTSDVFVGRIKRDFGRSFVGALVTDREMRDGTAHNRVIGPDAEWRPSPANVVKAEALFSETRTPNLPDVASEWNGRQLNGYALQTSWAHNTRHLDWFGRYGDTSDGFRADTGFVPQVGIYDLGASAGWTVHPKGPISRQRTFLQMEYQTDRSGRVITKGLLPGFGMDTRWNGFVQVRVNLDHTRAGDQLIGRKQFGYTIQFSPSQRVTFISIDSTMGQDIDFANARPAHGLTLNLQATVQPTAHLAVNLLQNTRSLHVDVAGESGRLFLERVSRVNSTYTFTSRMFVRVIAQYVSAARDQAFYLTAIDRRDGNFSGSALFAYKLNWQSVLFAGYGDDRELSDIHRLEPLDRQFFVKISHAFQR
jgi:hypothetical protein